MTARLVPASLSLLLLQHADTPRMEHVYFWSAILIVITPLLVFGGIGAWLYRMWKREKTVTIPPQPQSRR